MHTRMLVPALGAVVAGGFLLTAAPSLASWNSALSPAASLTALTVPPLDAPLVCTDYGTPVDVSWSAPEGMPEGTVYRVTSTKGSASDTILTTSTAIRFDSNGLLGGLLSSSGPVTVTVRPVLYDEATGQAGWGSGTETSIQISYRAGLLGLFGSYDC